jgi:chromosome partitioning protein
VRVVVRRSVGSYGMQVIVLASRKGGAGKTTLSSHLAVEAERAGAGRVAIADTDPQGGLAAWYNARKADTPLFVNVSQGLPVAIEACRAGSVDILIIDTPPSLTETIGGVVAHADLVVVPVRPSPNDLRAIGGTVEIVRKSRKPMVFVCNQVTPRARITGEAAIALSQHGTVAPSMIASRVDFATSMTDGRTAGELDPSSRSAAEIGALWTYLAKRMKEEIN